MRESHVQPYTDNERQEACQVVKLSSMCASIPMHDVDEACGVARPKGLQPYCSCKPEAATHATLRDCRSYMYQLGSRTRENTLTTRWQHICRIEGQPTVSTSTSLSQGSIYRSGEGYRYAKARS